MTRRWFLVSVMFLITSLLVVGCGIPQEQHDAVVADRDAAEAQVASLQSDLVATESDLAATEADLVATESDLAATEADLVATESDLTTTQSDLTNVQSDLTKARSDLTKARSDLTKARSDLTAANSQIETLLETYKQSYAETVTVDIFDGIWKGTVVFTDRSVNMELLIIGSSAWVVFPSGQIRLTMERLGSNVVLYFMNQGGIWTETQVYTLSSLAENRVQLLYTRQVHNEGQTTWSIQGSGVLERE